MSHLGKETANSDAILDLGERDQGLIWSHSETLNIAFERENRQIGSLQVVFSRQRVTDRRDASIFVITIGVIALILVEALATSALVRRTLSKPLM